MNVIKQRNGTSMTVALEGRLDTMTAPKVEEELHSGTDAIDNITDLTLDMSKLEYISSAGLRVLLSVCKLMRKQGSMKVTNVNEAVQEVLDVTGFSDILTIC